MENLNKMERLEKIKALNIESDRLRAEIDKMDDLVIDLHRDIEKEELDALLVKYKGQEIEFMQKVNDFCFEYFSPNHLDKDFFNCTSIYMCSKKFFDNDDDDMCDYGSNISCTCECSINKKKYEFFVKNRKHQSVKNQSEESIYFTGKQRLDLSYSDSVRFVNSLGLRNSEFKKYLQLIKIIN